MPNPHTGGISTDPNVGGYQGPGSSESIGGGVAGGVAGAPPALPGAGETTYQTANTGPSMEDLAALRDRAIRLENENKRKKNDQAIAEAAIRKQAERKSEPASKPAGIQQKAQAQAVQQQPVAPVVEASFKTAVPANAQAGGSGSDVSTSAKKQRQARKKSDVDYFTEAQSRTASKQFRKPSKPKREPKKPKDTDTGQQHGPMREVTSKGKVRRPGEKSRKVTQMPLDYGGELPTNAIQKYSPYKGTTAIGPVGKGGIGYVPGDQVNYVTPEGAVYQGEQPITAIVRSTLGNTNLVPFGETELAADPERPYTSEGPTRPWMASQWGTQSQHLLPGAVGYFNYVAQPRTDANMTEQEQIDQSLDAMMANIDLDQFYPNRTNVEPDLATYEDYQEDYREGRREEGRYSDSWISRAVARAHESMARILQWYHRAYIPLDSEHVDERGNIRYSDRTEAAIVNFMNFLGLAPEERYVVMQMAMKALGLAPDRNGLFFAKSEREQIPDEVFIEALNNMMVSCHEYGHPYGFVNRGMFLGGTRCYPVGVMTLHEAQILCSSGHLFNDVDPYELISRSAETWVNETYPAIRRNVYRQENGEAQLIAIEDFVRSLCSLDGISPRRYNVAEEFDRGYQELVNSAMPGYRPNEDEDDRRVSNNILEQLRLQRMRHDRSINRMDRKRNRVYETYDEDVVDDDGVVLHRRGDRVRRNDEHNLARTNFVRNPKSNAFSSVCMSVANMAKFMGVVGYVPIMASGVVEHAQGNVNTIIANGVLFGRRQEFRPNNAMYAHITSEGGVEAIAAWKSLFHVGGQDALIAFYDEGYRVLNKENASRFLNDYVKREGSNSLVPRKARELMSRMEEATAWLMPGDIGFGKMDARRWLEGFMINNMFNADDPAAMEYSFSSDQVLEMMDSMGIERFMAAATRMNAGRDAMLMMRNQTLDRPNPITHVIDNLLRSNGVTNMVVTLGIDTYFTYGLNLVQIMIPFSNTFSYLAVKGINRIATGGRDNAETLDLDILNYQMGGNDAFGAGLRKNVIYDCAKLGNICLIAGFMYFVIAALGFDEPEDPLNKYVWSEYRIGRNLNLGGNDKDGNPTGIPVYAAWWLNDLTMFALPMAYALNAKNLDQKLGDPDPDLPTKLFFSGCHDMLSGCSLLDLMKTVNNVQNDMRTYEQMMQDPEANCPPDWISFGLLQAELFTARGVNKLVPNALKSLKTDTLIVGENALDHSAYKVYNRGSENPGATETVDDWFELQRRIESKYNPVYALFNNLTKNGYLFDDGTSDKTGYLFDEMPISTAKDPARMYWANKYDFDPDNIPGGEENRIAYTESCIESVIADIDSFESVEEAMSQGYMIPYQLRFKMRDYCYQRINFEENLYNQRVQEGYYYGNSAAKQQAYTDMKNNQSRWYDYLNNWVFNKDIPWTDEGYAKLITSTQDVYYYKSSGKPATKFDYWQYGDDVVEKRFLPRGDHPTSFSPFTVPDRRNRGYNFETITNWFKEGESGTDTQEVFDRLAGAVVPGGRDEGVYVNTAIFGGDPNFKTNELIESEEYRALDEPTMGYRSYVPWEDTLLFGLPNFNGYVNEDGKLVRGNGDKVSTTEALFDGLKAKGREDVDGDSSMGDMGKYIDKDSWKTSSYPNWNNQGWPSGGQRYYYSGGNSYSGNYNPKIYSNPRSVNADRAATMYTKAPQSARTTYLNPRFSTKGSREAYKRQDI